MASAEPLLEPSVPAGVGVLAATLSLAKTCVGTGVLALPYGFVQGRLLSFPSLVLLGGWNWVTSLQLLQAHAAAAREGLVGGARGASAYSQLSRVALGLGGQCLADGSLVLLLLGVCVGLQIQAGGLLAYATGQSRQACVAFTALLLLPLVLQRSMHGLAHVSIFGLAVLLFGLVVVAAYGVTTYGVPALSSRRGPRCATSSLRGDSMLWWCLQLLGLDSKGSRANGHRLLRSR
ncbi:hypothetical protein AB1Y20_011953 [Prymnesium parvum]|uniref:Amino acid transporter transmembrane domain-containing protein n=1 Tax=Prymnesium parvum TaxID=97485 RepID=A0AB34IPY3_PRYPA